MGRARKPEPSADPAVVAIRALASELQTAHNWVRGTPEADEWVAEKVAGHARSLGYPVESYWVPCLSVAQAKAVMASVLGERDPLDEAIQRDAQRDDQHRAEVSPAELLAAFGPALSRGVELPGGKATGPTEAYGPRDPIVPGSEREKARLREIEIDSLGVF